MKTLATCTLLLGMVSALACRPQAEKTAVKSESDQDSVNVFEASNELDGTWKQSCGPDFDKDGKVKEYNTSELTYSGKSVNNITKIYSDNECKYLELSFEVTGSHESGKVLGAPQGAKSSDFKLIKMQIALYSAEAVNGYNDKQGGTAVCGGGWVKGQLRTISKATCSNFDEMYGAQFFTTYYDIYKIQDGLLYLGESLKDDDLGSTHAPEERPKAFDARTWKKNK